MDTIIIGQGYNLKENTSVGKELIELFQSHRYSAFTCLVAFASLGGVSALSTEIQKAKERNCTIKVILGVDQKGTSKEALEEVLSWGVDAKIYHTKEFNIFHPKVYLFENEDIFSLIVGSNNLTVPGLVQNVECSLMIKDIKSNPVLAKFYEYWKGILDGTEVNLYPLTQELIDKLFEDNVITLESRRHERYDIGNDNESTASDKPKNIFFGKAGIQKLPEGFTPKRIVKIKKKVKITGKSNENIEKTVEESLQIKNEVLITEFSKSGNRWSQVNFPIKIFEDYFGAKRGDNSYNISLRNINKEGELGAAVSAQSVTVQSKNFRFELNCKETKQAYPTGIDRPIGIFIKHSTSEFIYQVLMPEDKRYKSIKDFLYRETNSTPREMKRAIVHVEAIHALYPELII